MLSTNVLCLKKRKKRSYCIANKKAEYGAASTQKSAKASAISGAPVTMLQITEDTPPDMLSGAMDLTVHLPSNRPIKMSVERSTPMMDLLVQITTNHHLQLSGYTLQALSMAPNNDQHDRVLPYKPNTPIGALDTQHIRVLPKPKQVSAPKNVPLGQQPFESTFRLKVHLPRNQLFVTRVSQNVHLRDIMAKVCEEKNLDAKKYEFRHPGNLDQVLDPTLTLSDYKITEVYVVSRGSLNQAFSSSDIMALRKEEERKQMHNKTGGGVFNLIFRRGGKSSSGSVSSGENRSISPTRSDDSRSVTPPGVQPPPAEPDRPKPPQRKRRPAPKPPQKAEPPLTICHSRNSSDSSGYHEASILSENCNTSLPRRPKSTLVIEEQRNLSSMSTFSKSTSSLAAPSRKKKSAPPPPPALQEPTPVVASPSPSPPTESVEASLEPLEPTPTEEEELEIDWQYQLPDAPQGFRDSSPTPEPLVVPPPLVPEPEVLPSPVVSVSPMVQTPREVPPPVVPEPELLSSPVVSISPMVQAPVVPVVHEPTVVKPSPVHSVPPMVQSPPAPPVLSVPPVVQSPRVIEPPRKVPVQAVSQFIRVVQPKEVHSDNEEDKQILSSLSLEHLEKRKSLVYNRELATSLKIADHDQEDTFSSSLTKFEKTYEEVRRSSLKNEVHSTLPNFKITTYDNPKKKFNIFEDESIRSSSERRIKPEEPKYVSRSGSFSTEKAWAPSKPITRSKSQVTLNNLNRAKRNSVEMEENLEKSNSLYDVSGLQSLEVMRSIQSKLKTPNNSTEEVDRVEVPYRYQQRVPAINMGTWSDRPKVPVNVKADPDYKFGTSKLIVNTTNDSLKSHNSYEVKKNPESVTVKVNGSEAISAQNTGNVVIRIGAGRRPFGNMNQRPHSVAYGHDFDISRVPVVRSVEFKKPYKDYQSNTSVTQIYQNGNKASTLNRFGATEPEPKPVYRSGSFLQNPSPVVRGFQRDPENGNWKTRDFSTNRAVPFSQSNLRRTESAKKTAVSPPPPPALPKLQKPAVVPTRTNLGGSDPKEQLLQAIRNFGGKKGLRTVKV